MVAAAAVLSLAACNNKKAKEVEVPVQVPVVAVESAVVETVADQQTYSSNVQPWVKNNIAPQTGGRIEKLLVEIGDYVNAGQVIARMDDLQLQQAELQVNNDNVEYARLKSLNEKGGISQSDFESFEMACKVHKASYDNLLKNTVLRSPVSGVISARNYDQGDMYTMSQPLYVVEQIVPVKLLIAISESDYSRVKKGAPADITVEAFPESVFHGEITNIYPTMDAVTHTFTAEVKVKNFDKKLRPGMYAKVTMTFGHAQRVIVPDAAVVKQMGSGDRYVYILNEEDSTVDYVKVNVGRRLGNRYVILDGVKAGDKVVTDGLLRISNGVKVNVAE